MSWRSKQMCPLRTSFSNSYLCSILLYCFSQFLQISFPLYLLEHSSYILNSASNNWTSFVWLSWFLLKQRSQRAFPQRCLEFEKVVFTIFNSSLSINRSLQYFIIPSEPVSLPFAICSYARLTLLYNFMQLKHMRTGTACLSKHWSYIFIAALNSSMYFWHSSFSGETSCKMTMVYSGIQDFD